ncbi:hypothetical protein TRAPUB_9400 [Trametes pubescens]|uniref:Berberine/berberine-like domain-containing protein n=1 Tax=Trametes pubescens TaxID=154538 RepID=A0A1M2W2L6_TRAPU|nr:hypothetical protein TRAPUB_9400 [Trametes pubescens]
MGASASHFPAPTHHAALNVLNATLGGRVHTAVPFARPCFSLASQGVFGNQDDAACARVTETYTDRDAITSEFSAYLNSGGTICQATGDQCLLDANGPNNTQAFLPPQQCKQGNLPSYYIDVQDATDVSAAFSFSRSTGVPLSIKNTGHDFLSRSAGVGSLALWVGLLMLSTAFSNAFGLAVDQVLQFEVVTPDGVHRLANACTNSDLFFALRGGGGGTFGVVLRVTMRALPQLDFPVIVTAFKEKPSVELQTKYVEFLVDNALPLASKGLNADHARACTQPGLGLTFVNPFVSMADAADTMADLQQLVETELNGTFLLQRETSYLSFYQQFVAPTTLPDNAPSALSSRLIPASVFNASASRAALSDALVAAAQRHTITLLFSVAPHFFKGGDEQTSVSPAWRSALWHVIYIDYWAYNTTVAERAQIYQGLEDDAQALRDIAPHSGVYWNEASVFEPDYAEAFWGANYERLLAIKRK